MNPLYYKVLHLTGAFMVFLAYGALIARSLLQVEHPGLKRLGAMVSGLGLVLLFVSGFGLIHKLQYGYPTWIIIKFGIWILLGGLIVFINRKPTWSQGLFWFTLILGILAALLGLLKPINQAFLG